MVTTVKPLSSMCAGDLMSRDVVMLSDRMSLQFAARTLSRAQVSGAPVVNQEGELVGVLSAVDFLHLAEGGAPKTPCHCTDTMWEPWQILDHEDHAESLVGDAMTKNPVTVSMRCSIGDLSRMMIDAHIHRVVVIDDHDKPVGIVSTTDILAAVARAELGY